MKVIAQIRKSNSLVYIRLRDDKNDVDWKVSTDIRIDPTLFRSNIPGYIKSPNVPSDVREATNSRLRELLDIVNAEYMEGCDIEWLTCLVRKFFHAEEGKEKQEDTYKENLTEFFDILDEYIRVKKPGKESAGSIKAVERRLRRYEAWQQQMEGVEEFKLTLKDFGSEMLEDFLHYHYDEYEYFCNYPDFFKQFSLFHNTIVPSSRNSISSCCSRLKAFLNWASQRGYATDTSFRDVRTEQRIYGTPYYLTIEERDKLYHYDFSYIPLADLTRDIFVFQCLVGCRVGDLFRLNRENIKDGWLEYVPGKNLANCRGELVRVPLADKAIAILAKYSNLGNHLFPKIDQKYYGSFIKFILQVAGINRIVTVFNPLTRQEERHPLYEVATTHTARKTFVGNLYKQVKDQALVASLTGHASNSVAFERYRAIDDDMKRDILSTIE